jgi:hypothetical protein
MVHDTVRDLSDGEDFVGSLSGSAFLVITSQERRVHLKERIQKRLVQSFDYFYNDQDRAQGKFQDHSLGVQISELVLSSLKNQDLSLIKAKLANEATR